MLVVKIRVKVKNWCNKVSVSSKVTCKGKELKWGKELKYKIYVHDKKMKNGKIASRVVRLVLVVKLHVRVKNWSRVKLQVG